MVPIVIICMSILIGIISYLRQKERSHIKQFLEPNEKLIKYYENKEKNVLPAIQQKNLLHAAVELERRFIYLNKQKQILHSLHQDRIISHEMWNELIISEDGLKYERKEIQAEAEGLKEGWEDKICEEARLVVSKSPGEDKNDNVRGGDDALFAKKREVLMKERLRILGVGK